MGVTPFLDSPRESTREFLEPTDSRSPAADRLSPAGTHPLAGRSGSVMLPAMTATFAEIPSTSTTAAPPLAGGAVSWIVVSLAISILLVLVVVFAALRERRRRRRLELDLEQLRGRIAEVSSMTGGLAHEIKNPLSTLVLNTQMLDEEIPDAVPDAEVRGRLHRRLGALVRETVRLRGILEDFLRYAGRLRLDPQPIDISALVADLVDFFHPQCEQASVLLRAEIAAGPIVAEVDESHLKQAVLNLMLNALQAMDAGAPHQGASRPELIVRVESEDASGDAHVRIHVIDTGPGIPAERMDEVFRPYVSGKPGGSGLGLPTARRIVEEHGGTLSVHSEPGRGSDFLIRLPRRHHAEDPMHGKDSARDAPRGSERDSARDSARDPAKPATTNAP